jgi:hypothetical protein
MHLARLKRECPNRMPHSIVGLQDCPDLQEAWLSGRPLNTRARCSQLRWDPIAALPPPSRRTPGRLSRGYHPQEEGLETTLRGYRPTIFALHRGKLGTGEFRRQPFSDE